MGGAGVVRKTFVDDLRKMIELLRQLEFDLFQPSALGGKQLLGALAIAAGAAADRLALLLRAVGLKFTLFHVRQGERVRDAAARLEHGRPPPSGSRRRREKTVVKGSPYILYVIGRRWSKRPLSDATVIAIVRAIRAVERKRWPIGDQRCMAAS